MCRVPDIGEAADRSTGFAAADAIAGGDIRSGTPADTAPEQKEGREVTVRKRYLFARPVLAEMFTWQIVAPADLANRGGGERCPCRFSRRNLAAGGAAFAIAAALLYTAVSIRFGMLALPLH